MQGSVVRGAFFLANALACAAAVAALPSGCSSSSSEGGVADDATPPPPTDARPDDAARPPPDAARDCSADLSADGLAQHLACTGLYADFASKTIAADARPYRPANEFWSDGAVKRRWLYLPAGSTIDVSSFDAWKMPPGTRAWKEFEVDGKLVETRLFAKSAAGVWHHTTYRWNADETDALRTDIGEKVPRDGGAPYEVPNTGQCVFCHDNRADQMLGIDAVGLGLPGAQGITLASLAAEGRLAPAPPATSLVIPDDGTGKGSIALAHLHTNCGICHAAGGFAGSETGLFMRVLGSQLLPDGGFDGGPPAAKALDAYTTAVCKTANRQNPDGGGPIKRIAGGDPGNSLLSIPSGRRVAPGQEPNAVEQMPPLVTRVVDDAGHAKLTGWIAALPACPP